MELEPNTIYRGYVTEIKPDPDMFGGNWVKIKKSRPSDYVIYPEFIMEKEIDLSDYQQGLKFIQIEDDYRPSPSKLKKEERAILANSLYGLFVVK